MRAVWLRVQAALRQDWRSPLVLALITGLMGALVLVSLAGARRTDTAVPRFLAWSGPTEGQVAGVPFATLGRIARLGPRPAGRARARRSGPRPPMCLVARWREELGQTTQGEVDMERDPRTAGEPGQDGGVLGSETGGSDELGAEAGGTDVLGPEEGGTDELGPEAGGTDELGPEAGGTDVLRPPGR